MPCMLPPIVLASLVSSPDVPRRPGIPHAACDLGVVTALPALYFVSVSHAKLRLNGEVYHNRKRNHCSPSPHGGGGGRIGFVFLGKHKVDWYTTNRNVGPLSTLHSYVVITCVSVGSDSCHNERMPLLGQIGHFCVLSKDRLLV